MYHLYRCKSAAGGGGGEMILCLESEAKNPFFSRIYDTPEKVWAASIFFVPCLWGLSHKGPFDYGIYA